MGAKKIGSIGLDLTDDHFFAQTGRHPLSSQFEQVDRKYARLAEECTRLDIEVFNVSRESLTAFPKLPVDRFMATAWLSSSAPSIARDRRVFFVNYNFLSCGNVFGDGLEHTAQDLKLQHHDCSMGRP
jgi:hypothetical protein